MSLCCVSLLGDRALVGSDSEGITAGGEYCGVGKIFPLPHGNAVLTGRGSYLFLAMVAGACFVMPLDLRSLIGLLPKLSDAQYPVFVSYLAKFGMDLAGHGKQGQEVVLVGWSPEDERMIGSVFTVKEGGFIGSEIKNTWIAPYDASLGLAPHPQNSAQMVELARKQARLTVQKAPQAAAGGRYIIAELERERMTIAPAYDFGRLARALETPRISMVA